MLQRLAGGTAPWMMVYAASGEAYTMPLYLHPAPSVRAQALEESQWRKPGPVTPGHPLQCLVVLESLRQSDGDWWVAGDHFYPEQKPVAWCVDTPENRAVLAAGGRHE